MTGRRSRTMGKAQIGLLVPVSASSLNDPDLLLSHIRDLTRSLKRVNPAGAGTNGANGSTMRVVLSIPWSTPGKLSHAITEHFRIYLDSELIVISTKAVNRPEQVAELIVYSSAFSRLFEWAAIMPEDARLRSSLSGVIDLLTLDEYKCASVQDESFPGFPSFPCFHSSVLAGLAAVLKTLLTNGEFSKGNHCKVAEDCCEALIFEAFFRFRSATIAKDSKATRQIPRKHTQKEALARSQFLLRSLKTTLPLVSVNLFDGKPPLGSMDVITPSFRAPREVLERILTLPPPEDCVVKFCIVCDNPDSKSAIQVFQDIEQSYASDYRVKVRFNPVNVGPGGTRNHGLAESCADYVCFLDDDVLVERDILTEYWFLAKNNPNAAGFIGSTVLPPPKTPRQFAIGSAGIAYFWNIASKTTRDLPWGITANLCIKRDPEVFFRGNEVFTRGGGGEDVDICLRLDQINRKQNPDSARSFIPAPKAVVHHPYWNNGECFLKQFFGWAKGDSALIELYPSLSFVSLADFTESMAIIIIGGAILALLDFASPVRVLAFIMAYAVAEWMYETFCHISLAPEWGGIFTAKVGLATCIVRSWSEIGRFRGQLERGTLLHGFSRRFDWFQDNWPEYRMVERRRALRRGIARLTFACWASQLIVSAGNHHVDRHSQ